MESQKQNSLKISIFEKAIVKQVKNRQEKKHISKIVLADLPEWFGIPEYTENYINNSMEMDYFALFVNDMPIGFLCFKETGKHSLEIFCMGILKKYHHKRLGTFLYNVSECYAKNAGYKYIQVKTVETGRYIEYDQTNAFYKSLGFYELEVLPTLWDKANPCQIYIKAI